VKVTVAKWYTPLGRGIDEKGITPDDTIAITEIDLKK
jgi:C-terminal processing protease CtpA/Prc